MSNLSTLLRHIYFFYTAAPCLRFPHCCAKFTFSTLLRHVYTFHTASPYLLFPRCCAIDTLSTKLRHVYFSTLLHHVYSFHTALSCLIFQRFCAMSTFPHGCDMCLLSTLLQNVFFFHAAAPCLLFIPPQILFVVGYTVFTLSVSASVRACIHASVRPSVTFCFLNILKSLLDFHQSLQTCSYIQDKYFGQQSKG